MDFKEGDLVATPHGNGYINEVIDDEIIVDLIDGDHQRQTFSKAAITLLAE